MEGLHAFSILIYKKMLRPERLFLPVTIGMTQAIQGQLGSILARNGRAANI